MTNKIADGGPAFDLGDRGMGDGHHKGRTLRQWYAGQALKGLLADGAQRLIAQAVEESAEGKAVADTQALTMIVNGQLAEGCLALADAMIAAERVKQSS